MKNWLIKIYYLSIILASGYGVVKQLGVFNGTFNFQGLMYYTILSNLIIFIYYLFKEVDSLFLKGRFEKYLGSLNLQGAFTLMIIMTGIIYHVILVKHLGSENPYGIEPFGNFLLHTYVPTTVFLDWLFNSGSRNRKRMTPIYWLSIPLLYYVLSILYASLKIPFKVTGSYYAYFFLDIDKLGRETVLTNVLLFSLFYLFLGTLLKKIKIRKNIFKKDHNKY